MNPDFERCEIIATSILAKQHLVSARIDVRNLQFDKPIIIDSMQNYATCTNTSINEYMDHESLHDGFLINDKDNDLYVVLYNADCTCDARLNWTIAHEIGHIYLGHKEDGPEEEIEAHYFAAQLITPEYVLRQICDLKGNITVNDICKLFYISREAADKRLTTFNRKHLYRCGHENERIWRMMKDNVLPYCISMRALRNPLIYYDDFLYGNI